VNPWSKRSTLACNMLSHKGNSEVKTSVVQIAMNRHCKYEPAERKSADSNGLGNISQHWLASRRIAARQPQAQTADGSVAKKPS